MGVLITSAPPPSGSDFNKWKVYRSTSKTGTFTVINGSTGQSTDDLTYYDEAGTSSSWYKTSFYNSGSENESALSDPQQGLSETYTTVRKVQGFLHLGTALTDSTTPTVQEVVDLINQAEDHLDKETGHAWRKRYSKTISGKDQTAQYEYHDIDFPYEYQTGRPIYLGHRKIRTMSASEGDALEVWTGSAWEDYLADKTEGRADDFWFDYDRGILYLKVRFAIVKSQGLRIKYRYGETIVSGAIERAATRLVAIDLMTTESRAVILQENPQGFSYSQRVEKWQQQADDVIDSHREFKVPNIHM